MNRRPIVGVLASLALFAGAAAHGHEVRPVCGLAVMEEESARDALALDVELARSELVARQEVYDLLEDLWEGEATERMRYLAGKYDRDRTEVDLARKQARLARQEAYLAWLIAVCGEEPRAAADDAQAIRAEAEERYLAAECEVRRHDIEVARVDQEWAAVWLASIRDLREHSVATRPDIIDAEYDVRKAEQRMAAAVARARRCAPQSDRGATPKSENGP